MIEVGHPSPPSPNNDPRKAGYPVLHLGPVAAGLYEISTSGCTQGSIDKCTLNCNTYVCIFISKSLLQHLILLLALELNFLICVT